MASASDEQIRELFDNLERENQKLEKEFVNPPDEEIVHNRQKRMEKRLRYWFSDLTDAQQRMVAAWSEQLAPISADWIENRRKVQTEFQRLLAQRNHSEEFADAFLALLNLPETVRSESYRAKIATNTERTLVLLSQVSASMTPDQQNHFAGRLESLANDFETLSCDPTQKT
jgi:ribosomal protein L16 Arg81 hydroxylase